MKKKGEAISLVRLNAMKLCSAALQREAGEISTDELVLAAIQYASAVSEWQESVRDGIDEVPKVSGMEWGEA